MFDLSNLQGHDWGGFAIALIIVIFLPLFQWMYWHNKQTGRMVDDFVAKALYKNRRRRAGQVRNGLAINVAVYVMGLVGVLAYARSDDPRWDEPVLSGLGLAQVITLSVLAVGLSLSFVLYWCVMLFNRPQWAVPPDLRGDPGLLDRRGSKEVLFGRGHRSKADVLVDLHSLNDGFYDYAVAAISDPRDAKVTTIVDGLMNRGPAGVRGASHVVNGTTAADVMCVYAERMASIAVHEGRSVMLERALVAAALGGLHVGRQESVAAVALVEDAAIRIGQDVHALFADVSSIVGAPWATELVRWLGRPDDQRSIEHVGFTTKNDLGDFRYVPLLNSRKRS
jgi:hypothetical protein